MVDRITHDDLMRYLDGESSPGERQSIERRLAESTELTRELAIFRGMKADMRDLSFSPRGVGDTLWAKVHRRLTTRLGWILLTAGAVVWIVHGAYLFLTSQTQLIQKLATSAIAIGILLLLITVVAERYHESLSDPYRDIHR